MPNLSATLTLDRSTSTTNQKIRGVVVVSNAGANPITVLDIIPRVRNTAFPLPPNVSAAIGKCITNQPVPAGGSNTFVFDVIIHTLNTLSTYDTPPTTNTYTIGCEVRGDDGELFSPTSQTVTIVKGSNYGS